MFTSISGATMPLKSSQRRGSKPSNFPILMVFLTLKGELFKISRLKFDNCLCRPEKFTGRSTNRSLVWSLYPYIINCKKNKIDK